MTSLADADLSELVDEWLDWTEVGSRLGVTPAKVRTMVKVHELAAAVPAPGLAPSVPAAFIDGDLVVKGLPGLLTELAAAVTEPGVGPRVPAGFIDEDGFPVKGLPGLLTVLHDGGYDDRECIAWLFTDSELPGRPIDALRENRGSEAKRRAQAMAF